MYSVKPLPDFVKVDFVINEGHTLSSSFQLLSFYRFDDSYSRSLTHFVLVNELK